MSDHRLHEPELGIVGNREEITLLLLPPFRAFWDCRRGRGAIDPRDRVLFFASRAATSTSLLPFPIREEELGDDDSVQEPESPKRALPKPALDKQETIFRMLVR